MYAIIKFSSPFRIKQKQDFKINTEFKEKRTMWKITNKKVNTDVYDFKFPFYKEDSFSFISKNKIKEEVNKIKILCSPYNYFIDKFEITNKIIIKDVHKFVELIPTILNKYNYHNEEYRISDVNNLNVIFLLLSYNENVITESSLELMNDLSNFSLFVDNNFAFYVNKNWEELK